MRLKRTIQTIIQKGEESGYVAFCVDLPVVTQGKTVDEAITNLQEAIALHLEDENLIELGFIADPVVILTMELEPAYA